MSNVELTQAEVPNRIMMLSAWNERTWGIMRSKFHGLETLKNRVALNVRNFYRTKKWTGMFQLGLDIPTFAVEHQPERANFILNSFYGDIQHVRDK